MDNVAFIYWCVRTDGVKVNFKSTALLDVGMEVPVDDDNTLAVIIDIVTVRDDNYAAREYAEAYNLMKFM